jgi:hypothetical protein
VVLLLLDSACNMPSFLEFFKFQLHIAGDGAKRDGKPSDPNELQVIAASITSNEQSPINSQLVKLRIEVEKLLI